MHPIIYTTTSKSSLNPSLRWFLVQLGTLILLSYTLIEGNFYYFIFAPFNIVYYFTLRPKIFGMIEKYENHWSISDEAFSVAHENCAMRVNTDGCLLGAVAGADIEKDSSYHILDIGTGAALYCSWLNAFSLFY